MPTKNHRGVTINTPRFPLRNVVGQREQEVIERIIDRGCEAVRNIQAGSNITVNQQSVPQDFNVPRTVTVSLSENYAQNVENAINAKASQGNNTINVSNGNGGWQNTNFLVTRNPNNFDQDLVANSNTAASNFTSRFVARRSLSGGASVETTISDREIVVSRSNQDGGAQATNSSTLNGNDLLFFHFTGQQLVGIGALGAHWDEEAEPRAPKISSDNGITFAAWKNINQVDTANISLPQEELNRYKYLFMAHDGGSWTPANIITAGIRDQGAGRHGVTTPSNRQISDTSYVPREDELITKAWFDRNSGGGRVAGLPWKTVQTGLSLSGGVVLNLRLNTNTQSDQDLEFSFNIYNRRQNSIYFTVNIKRVFIEGGSTVEASVIEHSRGGDALSFNSLFAICAGTFNAEQYLFLAPRTAGPAEVVSGSRYTLTHVSEHGAAQEFYDRFGETITVPLSEMLASSLVINPILIGQGVPQGGDLGDVLVRTEVGSNASTGWSNSLAQEINALKDNLRLAEQAIAALTQQVANLGGTGAVFTLNRNSVTIPSSAASWEGSSFTIPQITNAELTNAGITSLSGKTVVVTVQSSNAATGGVLLIRTITPNASNNTIALTGFGQWLTGMGSINMVLQVVVV
jgi:hypothetical protein